MIEARSALTLSLPCVVWGFRLFLCYGKVSITGILNKKSICEWLEKVWVVLNTYFYNMNDVAQP